MEKTITRAEAQAQLLELVRKASPDEMASIYNFIFPDLKVKYEDALADLAPLAKMVYDEFVYTQLTNHVALDATSTKWTGFKNPLNAFSKTYYTSPRKGR